MDNVQTELYAMYVVYQHYSHPINGFDFNVPAIPIALVSSEIDALQLCCVVNEDRERDVRFYEKVDNDFQTVKIDRIPLPFEWGVGC